MGNRAAGERGLAMIMVLMVLAFTMVLAVALTTSTLSDTRLRGAFNRSTAGFYAAEAGLNKGMAEVRNIFLAFNVPDAQDLTSQEVDVGSYVVTYGLSEAPGNPQTITIPAGQVFAGLNAIRYTYLGESKSAVGSAAGQNDVVASVGTQFNVGYIPLFQFLAFYANDLEILPGPVMNLHGRIHSNADLYLNAEATLTVDDLPASGIDFVQVSAKGDIHRGRKDRSECRGSVQVAKLPGLALQTLNCIGGGTSAIPESTLVGWGGTLLADIDSIAVPEPDMTDQGGEFWQKADLRIALNLGVSGILPGGVPGTDTLPFSVEVLDASGFRESTLTNRLLAFMTDSAYNTGYSSMPGVRPIFYTDVPNAPGCNCSDLQTSCNNARGDCYTASLGPPAGTTRAYANNIMGDLDYRRGGFYNWRERKWMLLLNLNVHDLLDWNMRQAASARLFDPADRSDGGIVLYLTVIGPSSGIVNNYGVRAFGSGELPFPAPAGSDPAGITVVSDQAVYIVGNYNNVTWQPAALIGDSVNVLSSTYFNRPGTTITNDCQSTRALTDSSRDAANTTVNAAFMGGVDETRPGSYNGGLENYPRFHEDWGGRTLTYLGSLVSLGTPRHVRGAWCGTGSTCNIYNPPGRNWDYDGRFNDVRNLPPLTPRSVYVEQVLFSQSFL